MDYNIMINIIAVVFTIAGVVFGVKASVSNLGTKIDSLKELMQTHQARIEAAHNRIDRHVLEWHKKEQ